jgi:predicted ATPase/DNA-binding CsgD family transcriptional regulator
MCVASARVGAAASAGRPIRGVISGAGTHIDDPMEQRKTRRDDGGRVAMAITPGRRHSRPGNLPVELSSFVGRGRELSEIKRLLPETHAVTLTGPGGIGKTRLALRAGHAFGRYFAEGVWLVELADVESAELVPYALAHALKVPDRPGVPIDDALVAYLDDRKLLIVLDNCEHLLGACRTLVTSILSRCEEVRILSTSRQRLGIHGEAVVTVSALELPAGVERLPIAALADVEALRLLVDRTRAAQPDFALTPENRDAATAVCRRLDGQPLALELAAVRLASMTAPDLLERLDDRFRLLALDRGSGSRRQQALRATVEWSHELLSDEERILWRRLSVFAGSFGIDAAETVCSGNDLEREHVLGLIASLVEKSILTTAERGARSRYRLLETMRLYGAERLREAGEEAELQRRHADWYYALVARDDLPWWTVWEADLVDVLDAERANLDAALSFYAASPRDASAGLRLATDLWPYWVVRGNYRIGRRRIAAFLATAQESGSARSLAFFAAGFLAQAYSDHEGAQTDFDEAYRLSEEIDAPRARAYALLGLGLIRLRGDDLSGATEAFFASRETMLEVADDPAGRALGLYFLATALAVQGQLSKARSFADEALEALDVSNDSLVHGVLNTLVGILEWLRGDLDSAEARLREAVRIEARLGHHWGLASSFDALAWVAVSSGRLERAALLLGGVASVWQEVGIEPAPYWRDHHDSCEAAARTGLGEARYHAVRQEGLTLDEDQIVAIVLEGELPSVPRAASSVGAEAVELTDRELEVARLVASGLTNEAIAAQLFVTRATVKTHVSHILRKLTLESRVQLAGWVAAHGLGQTPAGE